MPSPISASWNTTGGDWSTPGNWDEPNQNPPPPIVHYVPGAPNAVDISNSGSTSFTVTYNTTDEIYSLSGSGNVIIKMTGGSLTVDQNSFTYDEIDVGATASLIAASGSGLTFAAGVISGTLGGAGTIKFVGGAFSWNAGTVLSVSSLILGVTGNGFGSTTTMNTSLSYAGAFTLDNYSGNNATINLNGKTLTLTGSALLGGVINGPGTLVVDTSTATQIVAGITGGATVEIKTAAQQVSYSYSTMSLNGQLKIDAGASYTAKTTGGITDNGATDGTSAAAQYLNNGSFIDDSGGGIDTLYGHFTNNGTLTVNATDTLKLIGVNTLGGTINGSGTLVIGGGSTALNTSNVTVGGLGINGGNGGATLTLGTDLSYAGAFAFDNQFDALNLNGHTLTLSGASNTLSNAIQGAGTLKVTGAATVGSLSVGGGTGGTAATITDAGSVTQTGYFSLNGTLQILTGATYTTTTTAAISDNGATDGTSAAAKIVNSGTFTDNSGGGSYTVYGHFTNNGTLTVAATDTMFLVGVNTLGGTINGAGTLVIGGGSTTLNSANVTVGGLGINGGNGGATLTLGTDLSYAGAFAFDNQFDALNLNGHTLTLSGSSNTLSNAIQGTGTLKVTGAATVVYLTAGGTGTPVTIINQGTITENQHFGLNGSLDNQTGAVLDFTQDSGISNGGSTSVTNEGTIEKTAGTGTSTIYGALTSSGTVNAQTGIIAASGSGGTISGTLEGNEIDLRGGGTYTLSSALSPLSVGTFGWFDVGTDIKLGQNFSYAGTLNVEVTFGNLTVDLGGHTLTLTKAATVLGAFGAVVVTGGGRIVVAHGATAELGGVNIAGGIGFENAGAVTADYDITLDSDSGNAATVFQNDAQGVVTITQDRTIFTQTGTAALITNLGKIVKTTGAANSQSDIYDAITNTGTIEVDQGNLSFHTGGSLGGTLSGAGALTLRGGKTYTLSSGLANFSVATLNVYDGGTSLVLGKSLSYGGTLNAIVNFTTSTLDLGTYTLTLTKAATFAGAFGAVQITDGGRLVIAQGATANLSGINVFGGVTIENAGTVADGDYITLDADSGASQSLFQNDASGVLNIGQDTSDALDHTGAAALVTNAGKVVKTGGTGTSLIRTSFTDTGTVTATTGTLAFAGPTNSFAGSLTGAGAIAFSGGATTLSSGTKASVAGLSITGGGTSVTLGTNLSYAGAFSQGAGTVLGLTAGYLLLSGAATFAGATVDGSQRLYAEGATTVTGGLTIGGTAVFEDTKTVNQSGGTVTVGDGTSSAAILFNYAGGTYAITDDSGIARGTAAGSYLLNQGLFEKTGGTGTSTVALPVVDTGSVAATSGTLAFTGASNSFAGAIGGAGSVTFGGGATTLKSGTTATVAALNLAGGGTAVTLAENLTYAGAFSAGAGTTLSIGSGDRLSLTGTSGLGGTVSGAGTLAFAGGSATLNSGAALTAAALALSGSGTSLTLGENLAYAGPFSAGAGATLKLTGGYLLLSGATTLSDVTVTGSQRLYAEGATTISGLTIGGTAVVETTKAVTQAGGTVTVGDATSSAAILYTYGGSTYSITDDSSIARGTSAGSYILDQGILQKTGGTGTSTIGTNIANNVSTAGTVGVSSGTLDLGGTLSGNLALKVGAGSTLILEKSAAAGAAAAFTGGNATLQLSDARDYHGTIAGFAGTETLDLRSIGYTGAGDTPGYSGNATAGTLTVTDGTHTASLAMVGNYTPANFHLASDGHNGTAVTFV